MARLVASFLGSGLILGRIRGADAGSGTVAAAAALLFAYWLPPVWGRAGAFVLALVAGYWAVSSLRFARDDPAWVVIDEAAGMFLASIGLGLLGLVTAFVVFRVADIGKKIAPGVARAERLPGATGIMADDLVAGLYGLAAGWLVQSLL